MEVPRTCIAWKIVIFKTLTISKIIFVSYLTNVPSDVIQTLKNIHKYFVWDGKRAKIKHSTLINDYPDGGLKVKLTLVKTKTVTYGGSMLKTFGVKIFNQIKGLEFFSISNSKHDIYRVPP